MERNRIIPETEQQQKQVQQERQRQENQCNAALAVSKHFEESLRRAKEKQMQAWTINPIPPTSQPQPTQQHHFITNQKSPPLTQTMPTKVSEFSNDFPVKRNVFEQNKNSSYYKEQRQNQSGSQVIAPNQKPEYIPKSEHTIKIIPDDTTITRNDSASSNQVPAFTGFNYSTAIDYKDLTSSLSNQQPMGVIVKHDTSQNIRVAAHQNVKKIQSHLKHQNLPSQPTALQRKYSNDLPQLPSYMNAQSKQRVSSPAPSKIFVCPEIKIRTSQERRFFTEPPPAHSNHLLPLHSLPSLDIAIADDEMKPLDLGLSDRHRKDGVVIATQTATAESSQNTSNDPTQTSLGNIKTPHITVVTPQMHLSNLTYLNDVDDNSSNMNNNTAKKSDEYDDTKVISNRSNDDDENENFGRNIAEQDTLISINSSDEVFDPHSSCKNPSTNSLQNAPVKQSTDNEKTIDITSVAPMKHLKKAWLQRHTGATSTDCENSVMVEGEQSKVSSNHSTSMCKSKSNSVTTRTGIATGQNCSNSSSYQTNVEQKRKISRSKRRKLAGKKKSQEIGAGIPRSLASASDRESGDSDMSESSIETTQSKEVFNAIGDNTSDVFLEKKEMVAARKRGRYPKYGIANINVKRKKSTRPPLFQLKRTGEPFLQDAACFEVAPKLAKCRECRLAANQRSKNIFCRFFAFRKLRYTKTGILTIAGFCDPYKDPTDEDLKLWMPDATNPPKDLDLIEARFLLAKVADQFCDLFFQEEMAMPENMSSNKVVAWKRVVQGVREMCDVCETSLFNYHWVCSKCGFVVCIDCYKARKSGENKVWNNELDNGETDEYSWLFCTNRSAHIQERLMLTQIIAGDTLQILARRIHHARALWKIPQNCACLMSHEEPPNATNCVYIQSILNQSDKMMSLSSSDPETNCIKAEYDVYNQEMLEPQLSDKNEGKIEDDSSDDGSSLDENHSTLRNLLIGHTSKLAANSSSPPNEPNEPLNEVKVDAQELININSPKISHKTHKKLFDEMMANTLESVKKKEDNERMIVKKNEDNEDLISNQPRRNRYLPIRVMTMALSQELYPNVKHMWFCEGKLLRLLNPADNVNNLKIFQQQWKRGQPVLVSHVDKCLNIDLWRPESFSNDFGEDGNDLVNCLTGTLVPNQPMKRFWDGFDCISKRIKDENGEPMLLKLKDWPPGEDFSETLPSRYTDLMKSLPLCDYTKRNGKFNLASRLPECFVKPDLGPKMYNAYGSASHPTKGTTNLHLDISDAVNVMVYVGIPKDSADNNESIIKEAYRAIDEAGCDILQRRRVRDKNELPGALWHIFAPRDANKIRDLLNKVAIERGTKLERSHDAIHDQSWYLDSKLRERLYREYGVEGYSIAQCLGDAVFIPAGAPHQVRNLLNCIKVAEDFVSPENVSECFHLTQEFRSLSDTHSNHEDKLQIKNIIYHAVKDALSLLSHALGTAKEEEFDLKEVIKPEPSDESHQNTSADV